MFEVYRHPNLPDWIKETLILKPPKKQVLLEKMEQVVPSDWNSTSILLTMLSPLIV